MVGVTVLELLSVRIKFMSCANIQKIPRAISTSTAGEPPEHLAKYSGPYGTSVGYHRIAAL
ncbi:cell division protein ZapD [Pseudomonas sp. S31]|nr:cell division protein ZapD [Pseudomonas sp. S31]